MPLMDWILRGPAWQGIRELKASHEKQKRRGQRTHAENMKEYQKTMRSFRESEKTQQALSKRNLQMLKKYGGESFQQYPRMTTGQQGLLDYLTKIGQGGQTPTQQNPLYQSAQQNLMDLLSNSPDAYEKFKKPVMEEFNREIVPGISEQFAGLGALSSSGFQNALGDAGTQLGYKLGALRAGLQQSGLDRALQFASQPYQEQMQAAQLGLNADPFVNIYRAPQFAQGQIAGTPPQAPQYQKPQSLLSQFGQGLLPGVGAGIGTAIGGPIGGAAGSAIGGAFSSVLGNQAAAASRGPRDFSQYQVPARLPLPNFNPSMGRQTFLK